VTALRTLEGVDVRGKRVLVRVDVNVDLDARGQIEAEGDHRLRDALPTIRDLRERGARVILLSHLGRPEGKPVETFRIGQVADRLSRLLGVPVQTTRTTVGPDAAAAVGALHDGDVLFLENVRFDPREEQNDRGFAQELASLGDLYVNEAFPVSHRAHASLAAITACLPSYAGKQFAEEVRVLETVLTHPRHPVVAAISGAKIETKAKLLNHLLPKVDHLLTGGGIANMFLQAKGSPVGTSLLEPHMAKEVARLAEAYGETIIVPEDVRVLRKGNGDTVLTVDTHAVGPNDTMYDVGPKTIAAYCRLISASKTFIWNGPLGKVEESAYQEGTRGLAQCVLASRTYSVVGGGDTVTALRQLGLAEGYGHLSSGGGAMIAFLEGETLPAVEALRAH
jgi:phosphoglycerate kinase